MAKRPEDLSPHYKANNEGGYGNAPVSGQFATGGKPGPGRPRGSTSLAAAMRKTFSKKIIRKDKNGNIVDQVSPTQALAEKALQLGLTSNFKANEGARQLAEKYGPPEETPAAEEEAHDYSLLSDSELELLGMIMAKLTGNPDLGAKPISDHPLAYAFDLNDARNYYEDRTFYGTQYRRSLTPRAADTVIHPGNMAYHSAARPLQRGCFRRPTKNDSESR